MVQKLSLKDHDISIHWFRQDLRLSDNPALSAAAESGTVLPIYILDDQNCGDFALGAASQSWLHHSLHSLNKSLGGKLSIYRGNPIDILRCIATRFSVKSVCWNRCYEPWRIIRDTKIKEQLKHLGIEVKSTNGSLLWEPWTIKQNNGSPYKVFTPFYRKGCLQSNTPRTPLTTPLKIEYIDDKENSFKVDQLNLLPKIQWNKKFEQHWEMGEEHADVRLNQFIKEGLSAYKNGRNFPAKPYVSRLSPYLHFGEISPNQIWSAIRSQGNDKNIDHFCSELGWREFSYYLLYHNQDLPTVNLQKKFDAYPWEDNDARLNAWKKGQTGIPMVDAGMRELWQTGYMHNRTRMIVGSFLVKNLNLHWHHGERWFWDTLVDADLANNSASWQWVAGCGADPAPYFRIFNPISQGQKFDPDGHYIRRFVPELSELPNEYLFSPWKAPNSVLEKSGVTLGETYPKPIVDLTLSRNSALAAFESLPKESP